MKDLKIAIGGDHGGFELKNQLLAWLREKGCEVLDCGTHSKDAVDYPRIAYTVARLVASGRCDRGIMIDGAGIGSAMTANKVHGVRAAVVHDEATAELSRRHNDANVACFGARFTPPERIAVLADLWLATAFEGGRHVRRVEKMMAIERDEGAPPPGSCCGS